jgi:phosphatidylglycerophosphate synthase
MLGVDARMSTPALAYSVRDRSILLPYYKRFLVEPLIPSIPARISPNAITHGGHLINLAALVLLVGASGRLDSGWPFFLVPILVHVWLWCDHADGGHARRTGQCSALGEFLDHGLDLLNATYVICMTVVAFGTPPFWSVTAAVVVPAAAAITYWEQAETGVFQLGLLNQIESVCSLTVALVARGIFGVVAMAGVHVGPWPLPDFILAVVSVVALFGILRCAMRVKEKKGSVKPFIAPFLFGAAITLAAATGALGTLSAILVGASVFVFMGVSQLNHRIRGERPQLSSGVLVAAVMVFGLAAYRMRLGVMPEALEWGTAGILTPVFGGLALVRGVEGHRAVDALDRAKASASASASAA